MHRLSTAFACLAAPLAALGADLRLADAGSEATPAHVPANAPPSPWSGSLGLYSQYVSRGISYTHEGPALQGSAQYSDPAGWYAGFWVSNVSSALLNRGSIETDPYGGYTQTVGELVYDLGFWRWTFPRARLPLSSERYDTLEVYAGVSFRMLNLRYWREASDYFGVNERSALVDGGYPAAGSSRGSHYLEANLSPDLGRGWTAGIHLGRQSVSHYGQLNFTDYRINLDKDLGAGYVAGISYSDTSASPLAYLDLQGLNTARGKWVGYLRRAF
jgi:uncharacterized protein (TIGR02001 family)